ncbi:MAG: hypothetical protein MJK10_01075 [Pseudomonadales bacterium]|nr:hypothetical protein [Pseudomonadales bacterium]NRA14468.1 hypothetical protein [Oceanospirillaceae bacterium]
MISISGSLTHELGRLRPYSGMTGYDGIIAQLSLALGDPEVKGIMLDCDTPGGEVVGCFDTARQLRALVDQSDKPLWSLCYDMHCSAGITLASSKTVKSKGIPSLVRIALKAPESQI